jgi:hypothetical protein
MVIRCYRSFLNYSDNKVSGWIFSGRQYITIPYSEFEDLFLNYDLGYIPMLGMTNTWYIAAHKGDYYNNQIISTISDTIIDNRHYKLTNHQVLLREDTANRKVFARYTDPETEILLYDFSLKVEQSIALESFVQGKGAIPAGQFEVVDVGFMHTLNGLRKAIDLTGPGFEGKEQPVWVEGIGSVGNLLKPGFSADIQDKGELSCYYKNGDLIYRSQLAQLADTCMFWPTAVSYLALKPGIEVYIYPNPFDDCINIEGYAWEDLLIIIFDPTGKMLHKANFNGNNPVKLNTESFKSDFYIVSIHNRITGQLIKNKVIIRKY